MRRIAVVFVPTVLALVALLPVVADDSDGDGVPDQLDNCPTSFNPDQNQPLKISGALAEGGNVTEFATSPDPARVIYLADQSTDEIFELYSATTGVASQVRLNADLEPGASVG